MSEESKLILDRSYVCPICDKKIKAKSVKTGVARFADTCFDLRPVYKNINVTKYDVVCCDGCGYSALTNYFTKITPVEKMHISENVRANFTPPTEIPEYEDYSFEVALKRYKLALISAVYKGTKASDVGFVCLKMCWLYQDMADDLDPEDPETPEKKENLLKEAENASNKAYEYLVEARSKEDSPICGMDDTTFDYLLAALAYRAKDYPSAMKLLSTVSSSRSASARLKDKAYDLKEKLKAEYKESEDGEESVEE